jgi:hypothetical protein
MFMVVVVVVMMMMKLYMFRTVPLSIISGYSLNTQQWYMSYRFVDSFRSRTRIHPDPAR